MESIVGEENFVPNDTYLNQGENIINIITGPNMAGKSTYMRQTAVIALMAHIGSFVPAEYANIPILDRIFTRVGASDDLAQGQSTFMVEMTEVSQILKNATDKSLVILDEIGRGTSTYDGISLAWSIVEYIQENIKCKTLFATHYHELVELEDEFSDVKNYSVAVKENNDGIVFLRKIIEGGADKSYGIYVAELAKLPEKVIYRSREILKDLEKNHIQQDLSSNKILTGEDTREAKYSDKADDYINDKLKLDYDKLTEELERKNDEYNLNIGRLKSEINKLKRENKELKKDKNEDEVAVTQISFDNIHDDELTKEIKNLDILNMTPLDAMNALYNLQLKVKK